MIKIIFISLAAVTLFSAIFMFMICAPIFFFDLREEKFKEPKAWKKDDERRATALEKRGWR